MAVSVVDTFLSQNPGLAFIHFDMASCYGSAVMNIRLPDGLKQLIPGPLLSGHVGLALISVWVFTTINTVRLGAYLPQILALLRNPAGAGAVSILTWAMFAASHISTVAYASFSLNDQHLALIFAGNTIFCIAIVALTVVQRRRCAF